MKKYFVFLLPLLMFLLPSCNEDSGKDDDIIKAQLIGNWVLNAEKDAGKGQIVRLSSVYHLDANGSYIHSESMRTVGSEGELMKDKVMSVRGTWSVKKAQLELSYDLNSLTFVGYTEAEQKAQHDLYRDENLMLKDMHDRGDAYGMAITLSSADGKTYLKLGNINGLFEKTHMPIMAPDQTED